MSGHGRLDSNGMLFDLGWDKPRLAMDDGSVREWIRTVCRNVGRPLTVDEALKAVREHAAKQSPIEKIIPGYGRLK